MRRVVVTGLGLVTPVGMGVENTWSALCAGTSGVSKITRFDTEGYACQIAAEVKDYDPKAHFNTKELKKYDRFIQYGMIAADEAIAQAGLTEVEDEFLLERIGVQLGSGIGGMPMMGEAQTTIDSRGPRRVSPFFIPAILINLLPGQVSIKYKFKGPNVSAVSACASGAHAIGDAMRMIQFGDADVMVAGAAEAAICEMGIAGFASAKTLSTRNDEPEKASRPFDDGRDGFVMGEGAGVMILEEYEHAKARGANILCELAGFGMSGDGYHMTTPAPDGSGGRRAMEAALKGSGLKAEEIVHVNAHATSTPTGDGIETGAIKQVFGDKIAVSATKSMTGHLLGAAGSTEAVYAALSVMNDIIPPVINLENPSEDCDLDYVKGEARKMKIDAALSNSFGFGGTNASLIFKKV